MAGEDSDGREPNPARRWRLVRAGTDAIPRSLRRVMSQKVQSRLGNVPWMPVGAVLLSIGFVAWLVLFAPVFVVRTIQVDGVVILTDVDVKQAVAFADGRPLARVDTDEVAQKVATLAPVQAVTVTRELPSTLHIVIQERTAVAGVKRDNLFHLFDSNAVIFRTAESLPGGLVEVKLPDTGPLDRAMKAAARVVEALTPELRSELVRLEISGPAGILLVLKKDRMVTWGDAEESDKKAKVATALLTRKEKQIDVSVPAIVTIQ